MTRVSGSGERFSAFSDSGSATSVVCFTRGEASTLGQDASSLGRVRSAELRNAAVELGVGYVELFDYPDGGLAGERLDVLALHVFEVADRVKADLLLVFDEGGITGHPDHQRATEVALACAEHSDSPVLAWALDEAVASSLNGGLATGFVGRSREQLDFDMPRRSGSSKSRDHMPTRASRPTIPSCGNGSGSKVIGRLSGGFGGPSTKLTRWHRRATSLLSDAYTQLGANRSVA